MRWSNIYFFVTCEDYLSTLMSLFWKVVEACIHKVGNIGFSLGLLTVQKCILLSLVKGTGFILLMQ